MRKLDEIKIGELAELAKLEFNEEETNLLCNDLNNIFDIIDSIETIEIADNVQPLIYITEYINELRDDQIVNDLTIDDVMINVKEQENHFIKVPKVI